MDIIITHSELQEIVKEIDISKEIEEYADTLTKTAVEKAKDLCPVDSGKAKDSIEGTYEVEGNSVTIKLGSDVDYFEIIENGNRKVTGKYILENSLNSL